MTLAKVSQCRRCRFSLAATLRLCTNQSFLSRFSYSCHHLPMLNLVLTMIGMSLASNVRSIWPRIGLKDDLCHQQCDHKKSATQPHTAFHSQWASVRRKSRLWLAAREPRVARRFRVPQVLGSNRLDLHGSAHGGHQGLFS